MEIPIYDVDNLFEDVYIYGKLNYNFDNDDITVKSINVTSPSVFSGNVTFTGDLTLDEITCRNVNVTGIATVGTDLYLNGKLFDGDGDFGTAGQILSSDGTDTVWIDASSTSVANANNVGINLNSTDADQFIAFVESSSGNNPIRVDAGLKYNPNSNVLTTGGNIIPDADNAHDFGSSTKRWANIYSADLQLSNVGTGGNEVDGSEGSWTMQEGADDLFLINRVTGKKYKFNLTEIS